MMKKLVLVGAGHAHARVLLELARQPSAEIDVVLISPAPLAPYSGMVPGWMAGHYHWEACCIDFASLCRRAGARLQLGVVQAIDARNRMLWIASGESFQFDALSLDIGSTATPPASTTVPVMAMRPLGLLKIQWDALRSTVTNLRAGSPFKVLVVGGGAAGVEAVFATRRQLARWAPHVAVDCVLATSGDTLLPALAPGAVSRTNALLDDKGIRVVYGFWASHFTIGSVVSQDGRSLEADVALWAGGAQAHGLPGASGLACDDSGFIRVDQYLRSVSHPEIFAAGDCASWQSPLPKAGVFAVRMGPVLAYNLRAYLLGLPLKAFRPQRRYLVMLGTGDEHAVAAWGPFAWQGNWVWRWKRRIDQRFLKQYNHVDI